MIRQARRPMFCAATLLPAFVAIYYISFWLRFEGRLGPTEQREFLLTVGWVVLTKLSMFAWFRIHRSWGRFVTFYDLIALVQATTCSLIAVVLIFRFFLSEPTVPRSVFLLDWGTTIVAIGGARSLVRVLREGNWMSLLFSTNKVPVLIVGADDAGESLLRSILRNERLAYHVVGFVDVGNRRVGAAIGGVPVIGTVDQTCQIAQRHGVREILIATEELSGRQVRKLVDEARQCSLEVKTLPSYEQLISGKVAIQPRPVSINDLLRREPVQLDPENIRQWIDNRVLLVTGSAGSIGSEICRQLLQFSPKRLILVDRSENGQFFLQRELQSQAGGAGLDVRIADVLDEKEMRRLLRECRPDVIFHAAAYKHVPLMEAHPHQAVRNIVLATRQLADLATECGVKSFVLISTDKAVNPTSVMGACKRAAELYVQSQAASAACRFVTVRFGNVLDSDGSVVQVFRQQIAAGGPVTVTHPKIQRYFMTIPEAARLVIQAGAIGKGGEILLLDMGDPVRIVDLAADMIRLSGLQLGRDVEIEFSGLRPGEKLFEELHVRGERRLPTPHPKITVADRKRRNPRAVMAAIDRLVQAADEKPERIIESLQQLVPEYARAGQPDQVIAARFPAASLPVAAPLSAAAVP
ncbi:MAG: polysaccharide biosynthesis protein [Pirellulales bacterium]|nr:polysaccharide biosynthesis protein [Pirellulales bacterium]